MTLIDSEPVIRPISPEDEPLMVSFHQGLSDRTVYLRYFCSMSLAARTAHERLVRICFSDPGTEIVLVALLPDRSSGEPAIVGVGRLNMFAEQKNAELAVLVSDNYQHRGIGKALVNRLLQSAREQGIDHIRAEMLRDNVAVQSLLKKAGFHVIPTDDPGAVRAGLDL